MLSIIIGRIAILIVVLLISCGPAIGPGSGDGGANQQPIIVPGSPVSFNGGFETRAFPYDGACSCSGTAITCSPTPQAACYCSDHDSSSTTPHIVQCAAPFEPSTGWTVITPGFFATYPPPSTDPRLHPTARGNGGVFFQYGMGRTQGSPRPPGYGPESTALLFQTCDDSDRWDNNLGAPSPSNNFTSPPDGVPDSNWCFQTASIVVKSPNFSPTPGAAYAFSGWVRSTLFLSVGSIHVNGLEVAIRFVDAVGTILSSAVLEAPEPAPLPWTRLEQTVVVPPQTSQAFIEIIQQRNHQSNVYVDDIAFDPL